MPTFKSLPTEIRLHILSFAIFPTTSEVNICALVRARDGWHSFPAHGAEPSKRRAVSYFSRDREQRVLRARYFFLTVTDEMIREQHAAPLHIPDLNLNLLLVSRQFYADMQLLLPATPWIDAFFCDPCCAARYIKLFPSDQDPDEVAREATQQSRAVLSQRHFRRIRFVYRSTHTFNIFKMFDPRRDSENDPEIYLRRSHGHCLGWRYTEVKRTSYTDKEEVEEGKRERWPCLQAVLENDNVLD